MNEVVEKLAEDLGITAAEANALLTEDERAEIDEAQGGPVVTNATQVEQHAQPAITEHEQKRLHELGKETAREIESARSASDSVAKNLLLKRAQEFATEPAKAVLYLPGFEAGLKEAGCSDGIVKTRKTEAKAVVDAYARIVAEQLNDARDKLIAFAGGYHDFIMLAREIRGKRVTLGAGDKAKKVRLSETEQERAAGLLRNMSAGQAA